MKNTRPKKIVATALVLMLTLSAFLILAQNAIAATNIINIETNAYVMLGPSRVGVGQTMTVTYRIDKVAFGATIRAGLWNGSSVTITTPDGKTEQRTNLKVDSTSAGWFAYTPTKTGNYTFVYHFPAQNITTISGNTTTIRVYSASDSAPAVLTVQDTNIIPIQDNPLPTGYWTRPINAENKGWWKIADNWLMLSYDINSRPFYGGTAFAPYTSAPNSPHVLWNKPIWFGGMVGGKFGDKVYYTGLSYEQFYNPLILNGRIIYSEHGPSAGTVYGTRILDLYTGEEIAYMNNTVINFAQTVDMETPNEHGILPYLWSVSGSNWTMYDAFTLRQMATLINMPSASGFGTRFGPNGELLVYVYSNTAGTLTMWNVSRVVMGPGVADSWSPTLAPNTYNATQTLSTTNATRLMYEAQSHSPYRGVEWNVTVPKVAGNPSILAVEEGYLLAQYLNSTTFPYVYEDLAFDLSMMKRDANGNYADYLPYLWAVNRSDIGYQAYNRAPWNINNGVYVWWDEAKMQTHAWSIKTGQELWVSDPAENGWGIFTYLLHAAYGRTFTNGYDGHVRCYDSITGEKLWDLYLGDSGYENVYGTYPSYNGFTIADHKLYMTNDEHSPDSIMWRGGKLWCIDTNTGDVIWNMSGWMRMPVIADGLLTSLNVLDGKVYVIGKGPSKTTVETPLTAVQTGHPFMITGTVTDQSPGSSNTPAIADENMAEWMEYLHMQKQYPANAKGVNVTLTAIDPNGNVQIIGTVTSDTSGMFKKSWTPPVPGEYTITATFAGSESYGESFANAAIVAEEAVSAPTAPPTTAPTQPPTTAPTTTATTTPSVAPSPPGQPFATEYYVIIAAVAIIVVIAAAAVILRRRK